MEQNQNNDQTESNTLVREDDVSEQSQKPSNNSITQNGTGNKIEVYIISIIGICFILLLTEWLYKDLPNLGNETIVDINPQQKNNNLVNPIPSINNPMLEQRLYLGPSTYIRLPDRLKDISSNFRLTKRSYTKSGSATVVYAPQWTLLQNLTHRPGAVGFTDIIISPVNTESAKNSSVYEERKIVTKFSSVDIYFQLESSYPESGPIRIIAKKPLPQNPNFEIIIQTHINESWAKKDTDNEYILFENAEETIPYLEDLIQRLEFKSDFLIEAAQYTLDLENIDLETGRYKNKMFDNNVNEERSTTYQMPEDLLTTITYFKLLSQLKNVTLNESVSSIEDSGGNIQQYCDLVYQGAKDSGEKLSSSFGCLSDNDNASIRIKLDDNVSFCADSYNFEGYVYSDEKKDINPSCI